MKKHSFLAMDACYEVAYPPSESPVGSSTN